MRRKLTSVTTPVTILALLCARCAYAYSQTNSIDREIEVAPGVEVRVGIYTSIRPDCTAGPLPAIRLAIAPEHGTVTVPAGLSKQPISGASFRRFLSRRCGIKHRRSIRAGSELFSRPQADAALSRQHFKRCKQRT